VRFREEILREVTQRITQLGLTSCAICDATDSWQVDRRPVLLPVGGRTSRIEDPIAGDPDTDVVFIVRVFCEVCGYTMLFDSAKHHEEDEPVLEGPPPDYPPGD
jgi:hypothetical protein